MKIYRHKTSGVRVVVDYYGEHAVDFHPLGGGFASRCSRKQFDDTFTTAELPVFRRGTVTAEFLPPGLALPCYSAGMLWNGWGMPYLTRAGVDMLVQASEADPAQLGVWWAQNHDVVVVEDHDAPGGSYRLPAVFMPDGTPTWSVGAGSWCWDAVVHAAEST